MAQVIGVPKETFPGEKRVATVPEVVPKLAKLGFSVIVQSGAGDAASISDQAYAPFLFGAVTVYLALKVGLTVYDCSAPDLQFDEMASWLGPAKGRTAPPASTSNAR